MNKELQININLEDGSYTAKYNPENDSHQKAIECLKELKEKLKTHCDYYFTVDDADGWYLSEVKLEKLIENKIEELEKEQ